MKKRHLVLTVEDSSPKTYLFHTKTSMNTFIKTFSKKYKDKEMDGWWIYLVAIGITGDIIEEGVVLE